MNKFEIYFNLDDLKKIVPNYILINSKLEAVSYSDKFNYLFEGISYLKIKNVDAPTKLLITKEFEFENSSNKFFGNVYQSGEFYIIIVDETINFDANNNLEQISLLPIHDPKPLLQINSSGKILFKNCYASLVQNIEYEDKTFEFDDFFSYILNEKQNNRNKFSIEVKSKNQIYNFTFLKVDGIDLINIYGRNITTQKNNHYDLNRLSLVAKSNPNGVVFTNSKGRIFWCNSSYLNMIGCAEKDVLNKTPIEIGIGKSTDINQLKNILNLFYSHKAFDVELLHERKGLEPFWVKITGQPILDDQKNVIQYFAMFEDITFKKKLIENLEKEKTKYQRIIENMNLGLIEADLNENIKFVNQRFLELSGYDKEELIGNSASELFINQADRDLINTKNELRKKGILDTYEVKVNNKNGELRHWLISGAPNYDYEGNIIGSIGIHLDISEQKEQKEKLYLLSLIAEKNINAVIISDFSGKIEWANSSFEDITQFSFDDIATRNLDILIGTETDTETINFINKQKERGFPFNCDILLYKKDGEAFWANYQGQAIYDENNQIIKNFVVIEDITNKKNLEKVQKELMQSLAKSNTELEEYAQIVSHDLKSPLQSIHALISWIKEDNAKEFSEQTLSYLNIIENKVEKMDHLINGILTYSKIDKVEIKNEIVDINALIKNIISIIHIPKNVEVVIKNKLPTINADKFRMQQLFQNLISNAVNFIDKEIGLVTIDVKSKPSYYLFSIEDNGVGIAEENQEKIFKIFQSFSNQERSTGLGLNIVKRVIDKYNGKLWLESKVGKGTIFYIKLLKTPKINYSKLL